MSKINDLISKDAPRLIYPSVGKSEPVDFECVFNKTIHVLNGWRAAILIDYNEGMYLYGYETKEAADRAAAAEVAKMMKGKI